jgi:hypothetical protein
VVAGVWAGGHPDVTGLASAAHSGSMFPTAGFVEGGHWALVGPLASDMSDAAPSSLNAVLINSRLALMASHASLPGALPPPPHLLTSPS